MIDGATLDLSEPRRVCFRLGGVYGLEVNVDRSDVRAFKFDIDGARCEWIVSERRILIQIPLLPLSAS